MTRPEEELARVQVGLADATPLAALDLAVRDLSRVQPLLEQLLRAAAELLSADDAVLWLDEEQLLRPQAWTVAAPPRQPDPATAAAMVSVSPCQRDQALAAPLLTASGPPLGTLTLHWSSPHGQVGERDLRILQTCARQAAEVVERARLFGEAQERAARERQRATQLRALAGHALAITSAETLDELLQLVTEAAREVIGCHQGVTSRLPHGWVDATTYVSLSEKYAAWRDYDRIPEGRGVLEYVVRENKPLRLGPEELVRHPDWRGLRDAPDHPPLPDYLSAPLIGRDGRNLGLVQLSHKLDESPFSEEDEAILVQLAQLTSSAIERLEALEGERAARREAEQAAQVRALLADASACFAGSLEPEQLLAMLVAVPLPWLADYAVVHQLDGDGRVRFAAARHVDAELQGDLEAVSQTFLPTLDRPMGAGATLRTGQPQLFPEVPDEVIRGYATDERTFEVYRSFVKGGGLCVPLRAGDRMLGVLSLGRAAPYGDRELAWAMDLAGRASLALDTAGRFAFERSLAGSLQRSLLPQQVPWHARLSVASRYRPGAHGTHVGGDWYDLVDLPDGQLLLVVGDVMGRGVKAAAVMGQLRATVRAYALEGHGPAAVLQRTDAVVQALDELQLTTCLAALLDPASGRLVLASAGHLPALLVDAGGDCRFLEIDPGLPLGVGGACFVEQELQLPPGATVLLYTDGLVEDPRCPVDEGLRRLAGSAGRAPVVSVEELCERVLSDLDRQGADDDTALLALRRHATAAPAPLVLELPATPASARTGRRGLAELLAGMPQEQVETAQLLATELLGNAARHVGGNVTLRGAVRDGRLLVEVLDGSERLPVLRPTEGVLDHGRGVRMVDLLADRWGSESLPSGKRVWFELTLLPLTG